MKLLKPVIYLLLIGVLIYLLTMKTAPTLPDPVKTVETPGIYTSMPYEDFRKLLPKKFEYIRNKSTFLNPYDKDKLAMIESKIGSVGNSQMIALMLQTPNSALNFYRLEPIKVPPTSVTSFQFEQGSMGWFWFYGTFIDKDSSTASYMCYINRLDMYSPELRKELNLPMGSTTYYNVSLGVGKNGEWFRIPLTIARGEYVIKSDSVFSLTCLDLPEAWKCNLASVGNGKLKIEASWKDDSLKHHGFSMNVNTERPPYYNSPDNDGCSPCVGGAGTLYLSYTQMRSDGTMTISDSTANYSDGTSWLDRQWMNGMLSTPYLSLFSNTTGMFKESTGGLGKYIWLNFHLGKELQYMVYNFFSLDEKVTKGTKFTSQQMRYGASSRVESGLTGDAEVLETTILNGTEFPIKYKVKTQDGTYILDGSKFNKSACVDISNNLHWDGSGIIYDTTGKMVGTGFLEANQFTDKNTYVVNELKSMGLDTTQQNITFFQPAGKLPVSQGLPSLITAIIVVIIFIVLIVMLFKSFRKKKVTA
jgi:hypothetical protein